jgi:hypothetical protein
MRTTYCLRLAAFVAALVFTSSAALPQDASRDEPLARQFVYCAVVAQLWFERMTRPEAPADSVRYAQSTKQQRDLFYLAAMLVSDGEFVRGERTTAVAQVMQELDDKARKGEQHPMVAESKSCAELFVSKAVPLLKSRSGQR